MKKRFLLIALVLFAVVVSHGYAREAIPVEAAPELDLGHKVFSNLFSVTVTSQGKLVATPGEVFTEGGDYTGITLPYLISDPVPITYPHWAVRQGWQGKFVIAIEVLTDGTVGRYSVAQSTGHEMLDEVAIKAVKTWKFHPAMEGGVAVVTCVEIPIFFNLEAE